MGYLVLSWNLEFQNHFGRVWTFRGSCSIDEELQLQGTMCSNHSGGVYTSSSSL
jgi:hypothetical protein